MGSALINEDLTHSVIGAFFEVYNNSGFGFLEPFYANALALELTSRGHDVRREVRIDLAYKNHIIGHQRLDMVVDNKLIIEVKATENLHRDAHRQIISYLRATEFETGLLLHFSPSGARFFRFVGSNDPRDPRNRHDCSSAAEGLHPRSSKSAQL